MSSLFFVYRYTVKHFHPCIAESDLQIYLNWSAEKYSATERQKVSAQNISVVLQLWLGSDEDQGIADKCYLRVTDLGMNSVSK